MATSTQNPIFTNLYYNSEIRSYIVNSGGTIVFAKDNVIVASEVSESQYRELLKSPLIEKIDVLPLKRYANEGIKYVENEKSNEVVQNTTSKGGLNNVSTQQSNQSSASGG